ncbi:hypothetical protein [Spirosoma linguale]|uniref:Uncharacterized protein n=1 Tax=Spirosoma linguale (strain ATCC 33905 / DSM 74 / LMG 10896 / Claus 1) TaxID=504472 RepID=D2QBZ5_SPILD|nr:hypothetical protein Slin_3731 [Spirosoma linguale DSM 74]
MRQSISWQQRRVELLKAQLQQRKNLLVAFKQAQDALRQVHQAERDEFLATILLSGLTQIHLQVKQAAEQQHLINEFADFNRAMLQCRRWEERALAHQIEQERIRQQ